jgi:hypothetical protein
MTVYPLRVQCPACHSSDITYTCEPRCCFNHICAVCYTTFELFTEILEQSQPLALGTPVPERDCLAPTVACARCESVEVYMVEPGEASPGVLICCQCHTLLRCTIANVEAR